MVKPILTSYSPSVTTALADYIASFRADPYGFVMAVYPWGEPLLLDGTRNSLAKRTGPEKWQTEFLQALGEHIRNNDTLLSMGLDPEVWMSAVGSGHGVGKSALVAWLIQFFMSTRPKLRGAVTAQIQTQLETKTWPELRKWHELLINKHWFEWTATSYRFALCADDEKKNYCVDAATVSEHKTEGFQGLHNEGRTIICIFDEASGIHSKVWEVAEGALTDGEGFFFAFGNMTRPDGKFVDCWDEYAHLFYLRRVDSREVSHTNKTYLQGLIDKYGIESDQVRVRILGLPPTQSYDGFFSFDALQAAAERDMQLDPSAPLAMAVDVARSEKRDRSVIAYRQGRDGRSRPMKEFQGLNNVQLARVVMEEADKYQPDAIVIEGVSGQGVIDILKERGYRTVEVYTGTPANNYLMFANKRAELWHDFRDWVVAHGCLPNDPTLLKELIEIQYKYQERTGKILMESKQDMQARGVHSPDKGDAYMLTFAVNLARRDSNLTKHLKERRTAKVEYDVLGY